MCLMNLVFQTVGKFHLWRLCLRELGRGLWLKAWACSMSADTWAVTLLDWGRKWLILMMIILLLLMLTWTDLSLMKDHLLRYQNFLQVSYLQVISSVSYLQNWIGVLTIFFALKLLRKLGLWFVFCSFFLLSFYFITGNFSSDHA